MEDTIKNFIDLLGPNVKTITYDTESQLFTITYKNGLESSEIPIGFLLDFLDNG